MRLELLLGWSRKRAARLRRLLDAAWGLHPTDETWERLDTWVVEAIEAGQRFGAMDMLIAAIARDHDMPVWSLDQDFGQMEELGFVERFEP